ncbi:MAG: hypothetical protein SGCHY_000808 [Lobulomycetales sp.]
MGDVTVYASFQHEKNGSSEACELICPEDVEIKPRDTVRCPYAVIVNEIGRFQTTLMICTREKVYKVPIFGVSIRIDLSSKGRAIIAEENLSNIAVVDPINGWKELWHPSDTIGARLLSHTFKSDIYLCQKFSEYLTILRRGDSSGLTSRQSVAEFEDTLQRKFVEEDVTSTDYTEEEIGFALDQHKSKSGYFKPLQKEMTRRLSKLLVVDSSLKISGSQGALLKEAEEDVFAEEDGVVSQEDSENEPLVDSRSSPIVIPAPPVEMPPKTPTSPRIANLRKQLSLPEVVDSVDIGETGTTTPMGRKDSSDSSWSIISSAIKSSPDIVQQDDIYTSEESLSAKSIGIKGEQSEGVETGDDGFQRASQVSLPEVVQSIEWAEQTATPHDFKSRAASRPEIVELVSDEASHTPKHSIDTFPENSVNRSTIRRKMTQPEIVESVSEHKSSWTPKQAALASEGSQSGEYFERTLGWNRSESSASFGGNSGASEGNDDPYQDDTPEVVAATRGLESRSFTPQTRNVHANSIVIDDRNPEFGSFTPDTVATGSKRMSNLDDIGKLQAGDSFDKMASGIDQETMSLASGMESSKSNSSIHGNAEGSQAGTESAKSESILGEDTRGSTSRLEKAKSRSVVLAVDPVSSGSFTPKPVEKAYSETRPEMITTTGTGEATSTPLSVISIPRPSILKRDEDLTESLAVSMTPPQVDGSIIQRSNSYEMNKAIEEIRREALRSRLQSRLEQRQDEPDTEVAKKDSLPLIPPPPKYSRSEIKQALETLPTNYEELSGQPIEEEYLEQTVDNTSEILEMRQPNYLDLDLGLITSRPPAFVEELDPESLENRKKTALVENKESRKKYGEFPRLKRAARNAHSNPFGYY